MVIFELLHFRFRKFHLFLNNSILNFAKFGFSTIFGSILLNFTPAIFTFFTFPNSNSSFNLRIPRVPFYKFYSWQSSSRHIFLILSPFLSQVSRGQEEPRAVVAQDFLRLINTKEKDMEGSVEISRKSRRAEPRRVTNVGIVFRVHAAVKLSRWLHLSVYSAGKSTLFMSASRRISLPIVPRLESEWILFFRLEKMRRNKEKGIISFVPPTFNWDWKLNRPRTFRNRPPLCSILPYSFWNE